MPVVSRFFGIVIALYWNDHAPPHFHAKYGGDEAVVEIESGRVLNGRLSNRAQVLVEEWRKIHQIELIRNWDLARQKKSLQDIAPLE